MFDSEFSDLRTYPSFPDMCINEQSNLLDRIRDISDLGLAQKWFVSPDELKIEDKPFAEGSNSSVYNCSWREINIVVKKPKIKKISILKDLLREIEIISTLRYPGVVQFLGASFDLTSDNYYIMLEKIPGEHLGKILESSLTNHRKKSICKQLIEILTFLHNCNPPIIYRDLKPDNILVNSEYKLKLTDFGLSRFFPANEKFIMTGRTGTVRYMAPEVFLDKPYDLRSDIYSLGMIFYYIYTGNKPFLKYDVSSMEVYFKNQDMIFSTSLIKNRRFKSIVNNCIEKDISKRWTIKDLSNNFQYKEQPTCCIF